MVFDFLSSRLPGCKGGHCRSSLSPIVSQLHQFRPKVSICLILLSFLAGVLALAFAHLTKLAKDR